MNIVNTVHTVANIASNPYYEIAKLVGKEMLLPMFINNISSITTMISTIKKSDIPQCDFEENDIEHKCSGILIYVKNMPEHLYSEEDIHFHLCGLSDILDHIKLELTKINDDIKYKKTWLYSTIGWTYYTSLNMQNINKQIKILNNRYDDLLKIIMTKKS